MKSLMPISSLTLNKSERLPRSGSRITTRIGLIRADGKSTSAQSKELQINVSLYICLKILSVYIFEKTELLCALKPKDRKMQIQDNPNQMILSPK